MSKILIFFGFFTFIFDFCTNQRCFPLNFHQYNSNIGTLFFLCVFPSVGRKGADIANGFSDSFFYFFANFS